MTASLCHTETPIPVKLARLYLVSDILHNCTVPVRNASKFRLLFQSKMDTIFQSLHLAYKAITSRMRAEQFRVSRVGGREREICGTLQPLCNSIESRRDGG